MNRDPIRGTIRTEKAPPVTMPVPYIRSQVPGRRPVRPALRKATVRSPPTRSGGLKFQANFVPAPARRVFPAARALALMAHRASPRDTAAAPSQTATHDETEVVSWAPTAAMSATAPMETPPRPDTPVKEVDRSIVSRMNRMSSMARS